MVEICWAIGSMIGLAEDSCAKGRLRKSHVLKSLPFRRIQKYLAELRTVIIVESPPLNTSVALMRLDLSTRHG